MNLRPKHHRGEDEEEETFKAQEDEKDDCCWRREGTALWGKEGRGGGCGGQKKMEAWRSATVLTQQRQYCPLLVARLRQAVSEVRSALSLMLYQHLYGQELLQTNKSLCLSIWWMRKLQSWTVRNEGGNWVLRGLKNRLTCPVVFKTVQEMEDHHDQRMERDECNVHLKKYKIKSQSAQGNCHDATLQ